MKNLKRVLVLLLTVLLFNVSCSSSDNDPINGICEEYTAEFQTTLNKYSDAYMLQYQNPSTANCNKVKTEAQNVIDFLNKLKDCIPASEEQSINELIEELQLEIAQPCD
jgi:thioredoxin-related protein